MLKEIHEQPRAVRETLTGKIDRKRMKVVLPEVKLITRDLLKLQKIHIVACGTAYHAGLVGKYLLEKIVRIPVEVDLASEFRYRDPMIGPEVVDHHHFPIRGDRRYVGRLTRGQGARFPDPGHYQCDRQFGRAGGR